MTEYSDEQGIRPQYLDTEIHLELPLNENLVYGVNRDEAGNVLRHRNQKPIGDSCSDNGSPISKYISNSYKLLTEEYRNYHQELDNNSRTIIDQENNVIIRTENNKSKNYLSQFTKWDRYAKEEKPSPINITSATASYNNEELKRHVSVKRKDFTTKREYDEFNSKKKPIFHKGFFKRYNSYSNRNKSSGNLIKNADIHQKAHKRNRIKFRNKPELDSIVKYINLGTLFANGSAYLRNESLKFLVNSTELYKVNPDLMVNIKSMKRTGNNSIIRRQNVLPKVGKNENNTTNTRNVDASRNNMNLRRGNTICTTKLDKYPKGSESYELNKLWKQYLSQIIYERIRLRLTLLESDSIESVKSNS